MQPQPTAYILQLCQGEGEVSNPLATTDDDDTNTDAQIDLAASVGLLSAEGSMSSRKEEPQTASSGRRNCNSYC